MKQNKESPESRAELNAISIIHCVWSTENKHFFACIKKTFAARKMITDYALIYFILASSTEQLNALMGYIRINTRVSIFPKNNLTA